MINQDIWMLILGHLDILWPYRYICKESMNGHKLLISKLEHELGIDKKLYELDRHSYIEELARNHTWNNILLLYIRNINLHQLIPCHLAIIEGYIDIARNIRYHFQQQMNYYDDELKRIDTYFEVENKDGIALILKSNTLDYIHLIRQDVFDNNILPLLEDQDQFALFMYPYSTFTDDDECTRLHYQLTLLFESDYYELRLPRCPWDVSKRDQYRPSYRKIK